MMVETQHKVNLRGSLVLYNLYDPTRTTELRNAFSADMKRRFIELIKVVYTGVAVNDCFGLNKSKVNIFQMIPPLQGAFSFARSADKVNAFMEWIQEQVNKGMLDIRTAQQLGRAVEDVWLNKYLYDSYKRGVIRARYELQKAGITVPSIEQTGGIEISMGTPFHIDRLGLIYTRVYNDLKGITDAMDAQISRILAQGLAEGDGPALLARKIVGTINGTGADKLGLTDSLGRFIPAQRRAEILARTEVIRAHHSAMIQEYRNWALEGVHVQAEWMTAGDNRVCDKCAKLQGKIFTLDEIEGMIPLHPQCRCIALPYKEGMTKIPTAIMPKGELAGT